MVIKDISGTHYSAAVGAAARHRTAEWNGAGGRRQCGVDGVDVEIDLVWVDCLAADISRHVLSLGSMVRGRGRAEQVGLKVWQWRYNLIEQPVDVH